jgi:enterochelin esterase-like enzyme
MASVCHSFQRLDFGADTGRAATDAGHVLALGYSLGSEAALLAADYFPQVFHGAIVYSPSSFADPSQNDPGQPGWSWTAKA